VAATRTELVLELTALLDEPFGRLCYKLERKHTNVEKVHDMVSVASLHFDRRAR
jgi:hypothetical protein